MAIAERRGGGLIHRAGRDLLRAPADLAFVLLAGLSLTSMLVVINTTLWTNWSWIILPTLIVVARLVLPFERLRLVLVGLPVPAPERVLGRGPVRRLLVGGLTSRHVGYLLMIVPLGFVSALLGYGMWGAVWWGVVDGSWPFLVFAPEPQPRLGTRAISLVVLVPLAVAITRLLAQAQIWIARDRLVTDRRVEEVLTSRAHAVDAQTAELRRIERDLHDGAQARLVALTMQLGLVGRALRPLGAEATPARTRLDAAAKIANAALADLRHLVRGIHPPILTDRGLSAALSALAADCPLPVELDVALAEPLPPAVEVAAYFAVAEAVANAAKHAEAQWCRVTIHVEGRALRITVTDNGRGGADPLGSGLTGLRHRVEAQDGRLAVTSPAGGPTMIEVELPCG